MRRCLTLVVVLPFLFVTACARSGEQPVSANPTVRPVEAGAGPSVEESDDRPTPGSSASSPSPPPPTPAASEASGSSGSSESSVPTSAPPDLAGLRLAVDELAILDAPTAMAVRPGDPALYVAERAGRVLPVAEDGSVGEPILDIRQSTTTDGERGLLGLAWAPDGNRLYVSSTASDGSTRLEAFDLIDNVVQADSPVELLRVAQPASNHNGGDLHIGPDGFLWLGLGDGGAANDQFGNGQDPTTLLGTMLRIQPTAAGYDIPADNPFAEGGEGAAEVWAYGLRNPWRFSFDSLTGDLWIADVGQNAVEEVNRVDRRVAGLNYGWPRFEGDRPFDGGAANGPLVDPVHTYDHGRGCSITGGYVYRGQAIPDLAGAYLYSDFCNGDIYALGTDAEGQVVSDVATGAAVDQAVSFGQGPDDELYILSLNGPIYRIVKG